MNNVIEISDDSVDGDDVSSKCFTQKSVTNALDAICIDSNSDDNETSLVRGEFSRRFSLSEFPEVDFGHDVVVQKKSEDARDVDAYTEPYSNSQFKNGINKNVDNSIQLSSEDDYLSNYESKIVKAPFKYPKVSSNLSSDESDDLEPKHEKKREKKKEPKPKKINEEKKRKQEEKQLERQRKQDEAAKQKALKQLNSKNKLIADPEHCLKLMEINYDEEIMSSDFFIDFLKAIAESKIKHSIQSQIIPGSITWKRIEEQNYLNDSNEVCTKCITIDECQTIIVWNCKQAVKHVYENTFSNTIKNIKSLIPKKKITLVIYKIEDYFKYSKNVKDAAMHDQILGTDKQKKRKVDKNYLDYPKISRKKFEEVLVEVQVIYNVNTRIIESQSDIALLIYQYTKSIALLPSKIEKRQESSSVDWYVNSDNRDTVKVDKDGNGLKRLWQQQLGQFSLVSLETSESIASIYKSPSQLMEAYNNCTPAEGEALLKDIPIRRAAGPLTSIRKVGPELSRKVYAMFTSQDGEAFLHE